MEQRIIIIEKMLDIFQYRAFPLANEKLPAELYLYQYFCIKLDSIFPYYEKKSNQKIKLHETKNSTGGESEIKYLP